jgi:hypothetical protein
MLGVSSVVPGFTLALTKASFDAAADSRRWKLPGDLHHPTHLPVGAVFSDALPDGAGRPGQAGLMQAVNDFRPIWLWRAMSAAQPRTTSLQFPAVGAVGCLSVRKNPSCPVVEREAQAIRARKRMTVLYRSVRGGKPVLSGSSCCWLQAERIMVRSASKPNVNVASGAAAAALVIASPAQIRFTGADDPPLAGEQHDILLAVHGIADSASRPCRPLAFPRAPCRHRRPRRHSVVRCCARCQLTQRVSIRSGLRTRCRGSAR